MTRPEWTLCDSPDWQRCYSCGREIPPRCQHWKHDADGLRMCWGCRGPRLPDATPAHAPCTIQSARAAHGRCGTRT